MRRALAPVVAVVMAIALVCSLAPTANADESAPHTIRGHVDLCSAGHPAGAGEVSIGLWVWVTEGSGYWMNPTAPATATDASGDFTLNLGSYTDVVLEYNYTGKAGYASSYSSDFQERPLQNEPGVIHLSQAVTSIAAVLAPGATIGGTLEDTVHKPTHGITAFAFPSPGTPQTPHHVTATVQADGSYALTGLPAGAYTISFSGDSATSGNTSFEQMWGATPAHPGGVTVTVAAGDHIVLAHETMKLQGRVTGFVQCDGDCLANNTSRLTLQAYDETVSSWVTLGPPSLTITYGDPGIRYAFDKLYPGTYRLAVTYAGNKDYDDLLTDPFVLAPGEAKTDTLVLSRRAIPSTGVPAKVSSYLTALYSDYLGRRPSASDVAWWGQKLVSGAPRGSVSDGFVNSDEYRLIRIDAAYNTVLRRSADPGGRLSWLTSMRTGAITTDDIEKSFYASTEFYQANGGTNTAWAEALYAKLLGRGGTASEFAYWAALATQNGRPWVVAQFWNSQETISARVSAMYIRYLGRQPDSGGLSGWVTLALILGDSGLRSSLTASDEYFARASLRYP